MLRDLLKEGGLYTFANLLTRGINLFLIPFYTVYFTAQDYGVIEILSVFTLFVSNIFSLQFNQGIARYSAEPKLNHKHKVEFASTAILFSNGLLLLVTVLIILFPTPLSNWLSGDTRVPIDTIRLATATMLFNGIFYLFSTYLRFQRKSKAFAILSLSHALSGILLIFLFVMVFDAGINSIYISYIIIVPILIVIQMVLLKDHLVLKVNKVKLKKLLLFCLPLIPAAIAVVVMNFSDRIYIKKYLNYGELGIYGMASKFSSIISMIIGGFGMAITPILYEKQYEKGTKDEMKKIFKLFIGIGTTGVIALSFFSKEFVTLFTEKSFHPAANVMPIMYVSAYTAGFTMFSPGIILKRKTIISATIVIFFALINIGLNHILVPKMGLNGAAIATLIAMFSHQITLFFISQKYYQFNYSISQVAPVFIIQLALIGFFMFWNPELSFVNFLLKLGILLLFVVFLFAIKLIDKRSVIRFIQRKDL
ncbi:MAG: oligosaccharide flippase family protein [Crocinitomicaceae bacterium]